MKRLRKHLIAILLLLCMIRPAYSQTVSEDSIQSNLLILPMWVPEVGWLLSEEQTDKTFGNSVMWEACEEKLAAERKVQEAQQRTIEAQDILIDTMQRERQVDRERIAYWVETSQGYEKEAKRLKKKNWWAKFWGVLAGTSGVAAGVIIATL